MLLCGRGHHLITPDAQTYGEDDMPFRSKAQRKWMHTNHPEMAKKWEAHTPKGKKLPEHVAQNNDTEVQEGQTVEKSFVEKLDAVFGLTEKKDWIKDATKNKGGLHKALNVPEGKKIPKKAIDAAAKKGGKVGKQAKLAKTLGKFGK